MIDFNAFFKISYGLYIVASGNKDAGNGFVSNSVFQVTSEPAQFAACCNKENYTAKLIEQHKAFSVCILKQEVSSYIIGLYGYQSGRDVDKLKNVTLKYGKTGVPIITDDVLAFIECKLVKTIDVGTHLMFIGEVVQAKQLSNEEPLTYAHYRNVKKGVAPKNAPTYIDKTKMEENMQNDEIYKCPVCGYEHSINAGDEANGIEPETSWDNIPETYTCPLCGAAKEDFYKL